jgi:hypothetical protein
MSVGKITRRDGQRTHVVMVAVADGYGIHVFFPHQIVKRKTALALPLGMSSGIQKHTMPFHLHHPGAGADFIRWVQVRNPHASRISIPKDSAYEKGPDWEIKTDCVFGRL